MRINRIYCPENLTLNSDINLPPQAGTHVAKVLRARIGDKLTLFNGQGGEYLAEIASINRNKVSVTILKHESTEKESPLQIELGQVISRSDRMDFTLQKATELGVTCFSPLIAERSSFKLDQERLKKKMQHWQQVIVSACEQCGRNTLPILNKPQAIKSWCQSDLQGEKLILQPDAKLTLQTITSAPTNVTLLIGAEGGLNDTEISLAQDNQFKGINLGKRILRTETAALTIIAIAQSRWGDLA